MNEAEAIYALWYREFKVFTREKSRVVTSVFTPLLWIFVFGGGLGSTIDIEGINYQVFIYPGVLAMSVLFSSVFYGVYIIWDRKIDILKEVLVAPLSRTSIFVGKVLGGCTDSMIQAFLMLMISFTVGVYLTPYAFLMAVLVLFLLSLSLVSAGLIIGSVMESPEGFNMIISFLVFPLFFFSGALYPLNNLPPWLAAITYIDPVTYGVDALRTVTIGVSRFPIYLDLSVLAGFALVMFTVGTIAFERMNVL
ncbi:MAG: ABC transporter permease [Candidatus Bathyarchaeota archaeon]|jgi:ABC-2 type transport system permease protein|nr:ABC transporter permease [Candidatus Bathyarchaeota archaeon]